MTSTKEVDLAKVNTLVFEGGSVKGIVYVGALGVLHQKYLLDTGEDFLSQITDVGGTSAGSIMAMFTEMNLNIETITRILVFRNFKMLALLVVLVFLVLQLLFIKMGIFVKEMLL
jgi:predicted acylesterase/phospholipase RssA